MMTFDLKLIFSGLSRQYSSVFGKMIFPSTLVFFFKSRSCGELKSPQEHVNISEGIEDNVICIFFHQSLRSLALPYASCHTKSHRRKTQRTKKIWVAGSGFKYVFAFSPIPGEHIEIKWVGFNGSTGNAGTSHSFLVPSSFELAPPTRVSVCGGQGFFVKPW